MGWVQYGGCLPGVEAAGEVGADLIFIVPKPVLLRVFRRSEPLDCRHYPGIPQSE